MKVIFVDDVPNVARVGQTKDVADGYARNFLFPRKLAVLANSQAAAAIDAHLKKLVKLRAVEEAQVAELAKKINGLEITLRAKVGENEKLYGSITTADISEALSKAAGALIDKKNVALAEPIKLAGVSDVTIKFMHEISAVIKVCVVDENATEEMIAQAKTKKAEAKKEKTEEAAEPKKVKAPKAEKAAAETPEAAAEPKKEKKEKKAKAVKEEAPAAEAKAEKPAKAEKAAAEEKPAKPAKEKKVKAVKEEAPAAEAKTEEKKEKKPRAKAKKEDAAAE